MFFASPFSPVHRQRKFSTVFGHTSLNSSNTTLPAGHEINDQFMTDGTLAMLAIHLLGTPLMVTSKKHRGSGMIAQFTLFKYMGVAY